MILPLENLPVFIYAFTERKASEFEWEKASSDWRIADISLIFFFFVVVLVN